MSLLILCQVHICYRSHGYIALSIRENCRTVDLSIKYKIDDLYMKVMLFFIFWIHVHHLLEKRWLQPKQILPKWKSLMNCVRTKAAMKNLLPAAESPFVGHADSKTCR